jgi:hypothetical protein
VIFMVTDAILFLFLSFDNLSLGEFMELLRWK